MSGSGRFRVRVLAPVGLGLGPRVLRVKGLRLGFRVQGLGVGACRV